MNSILIVDDSKAERCIISDILDEAGYKEIIMSSSAEEMFACLGISAGGSERRRVDLVLLDIIMPEIDGLAALERIKAEESLRDIPIIMVTARTGEEDLRDAFERGAVDFIGKPFNRTELLSRVRSALRLKHEIDVRKSNERQLEEEIRERKRVEETLRSFEKAIETMQIGVTITDTSGRIMYVNPAEAVMHGYKASELLGQEARIFAPEEIWSPLTREGLMNMSSRKRDSVNIRRDGSRFPVQLLSDVVRNRTGEPIGLVTTCEDISERKSYEEEINSAREELEMRVMARTEELSRANMSLNEEVSERRRVEETLRESENKYRKLSQQFNTLLEAIPDSLILLSPDLTILWANSGATKVYNCKDEDIRGMNCTDICQKDNPGCPALKSFKTAKVEGTQLKTRSGRTLDIRAFPIKDQEGNVVNVIELAIDITEKLNIQAEAMRADHLASLGELSAGVAHEINNPINGIINCAQILVNRLGKENRDGEVAGMIIGEGQRVANIVQALLSFARERKEKKGPVRLADVLRDTLTLTAAHIRKDGITLRTKVSEDLPPVTGHHQQIEQVFLNLISNAHYALNRKYPKGGDQKILEITAKVEETPTGRVVRMVFHDKGEGIPDDLIDKVMDPFFSTKPHDKGTGLGLSISHGIISDHNGRLSIESGYGEYTKVSIDLPI